MKSPEVFAEYFQKTQNLLDEIERLSIDKINQPEKIMAVLYKVSYIAENFITDEELFLRKHNYPDLENRKKENREFITKLKNIHKSYQDRGGDALSDLKRLLTEWSNEHPNGTDKCVKYFIETGETLGSSD